MTIAADSLTARGRAVYEELSGLQRQAAERTPSLRSRRRQRARHRRVRRSLGLLLAVVILGTVGAFALDVAGLRGTALDWYQEQIADPVEGR